MFRPPVSEGVRTRYRFQFFFVFKVYNVFYQHSSVSTVCCVLLVCIAYLYIGDTAFRRDSYRRTSDAVPCSRGHRWVADFGRRTRIFGHVISADTIV